MEILILVLLYYLSQNPTFAESVKPLMGKIKDSEQMLNFLNDLSKFSGAFGGFGGLGGNPAEQKSSGANKPPENMDGKAEKDGCSAEHEHKTWTDDNSAAQEDKKNPQSPTKGIADEFIQNILDSYLKKR